MEAQNRQGQSPASSTSGFRSPSFLRRVDTALGFLVTGVGVALHRLGFEVPEQTAAAADHQNTRNDLNEIQSFLDAYDKRHPLAATVFTPQDNATAPSSLKTTSKIPSLK